MPQTVNVKDAIKRGQKMVNAPIFFILFGPPFIAFLLNTKELLPQWTIGVAFAGGFVLAWLYWSVMITKWRIWAFENVDNPITLKHAAIAEKLIWPDGSIFEKTEIRTVNDKIRIEAIKRKLKLLEDELAVNDNDEKS